MGHKREIKFQFFRDEDLSELSRDHRLVFIGLWTVADKNGVFEDRPKRVHADAFPYDHDLNMVAILDDLTAAGYLLRYVGGGKKLIQIVNFRKHQRPHPKERPTGFPTYDEAQQELAGGSTEGEPKDDQRLTQGEPIKLQGALRSSGPSVSSGPSGKEIQPVKDQRVVGDPPVRSPAKNQPPGRCAPLPTDLTRDDVVRGAIARQMADEIVRMTGDSDSHAMFVRIVTRLPRSDVLQALSELKESRASPNQVRKLAAIFVHRCNEMAAERGISLWGNKAGAA